jgi:hypothetical protein
MNKFLGPETKTLFYEFPTKKCAEAFLADLEMHQFRISKKAMAEITPGPKVLLALQASFPE